MRKEVSQVVCFVVRHSLIFAFVCQAVQEILCFYFLFFLHAISSHCTCKEVQRVQFPALEHTALELLVLRDICPASEGEFTTETHQSHAMKEPRNHFNAVETSIMCEPKKLKTKQ